MAWHAELKRRKWYRIIGINMIYIYKKQLYDEWYNSLTDEEKQRLEEYNKAEHERKKREFQKSLSMLSDIFNLYNRYIPNSIFKDLIK